MFETFLPVDQRDSRETLRKTAKGYFDSLISSDPAKVHFHPDCNRTVTAFAPPTVRARA